MTRTAFPFLAAVLLTALSPSRGAAGFINFVSPGGSGTACGATAPCISLQLAHDAASQGGEIRCLGGGPALPVQEVTISKSITIDRNAATWYATVNGPGIVVTISNATVSSFSGPASAGIGIDFQNGAALFLESYIIQDWNAASTSGGPGIGVNFAPPSGVTARLHITDSIVRGNGLSASGGGVIIQPSGSGSARVLVERTRMENNTYGIFANGTGSTGVISVVVRDSVIGNNAVSGISSFTAAGHSVTSVTVDRSASVLNGANGILSQGANAFVFLTESTVMANTTGLNAVSGGAIFSYQNNRLTGNVTDGAPTAVLAVK
jgi:hypothetical protein